MSLIESWSAQAIVPVAMHPWREAGRGFNQAAELAGLAAAQFDLPVCDAWLARGWRLRRQAELRSRTDARRRNARGSFSLKGSVRPVDSVILVDDVATSGATLHEAAAVLRSAGVGEVHALTFLRG